MFDLDKWQEIFSTLRSNKLRTFLTAFSVAWGIFMLILLLGAGRGLENGVRATFSDNPNSIWFGGGSTSMAFGGFKEGRRIRFTSDDYDLVNSAIQGVDEVAARLFIDYEALASYGDRYGKFNMMAIHPKHLDIEAVRLTDGRMLNEIDLMENRKVVFIGDMVRDQIFADTNDVVGKYIKIKSVPFKIIGVFTDVYDGERRRIYLPITTGQKIFGKGNEMGILTISIGDATVQESQNIIYNIRRKLAMLHQFHPEDQRAVWFNNAVENFNKVKGLFTGIRMFVWFVSIGTIIAGMIGVSNIMLIVVKERTKEFGIRKAIGAKPNSITSQIIQESVLLTATAGYLGMVAGIVVLEIINKYLPEWQKTVGTLEFVKSPEADLRMAVSATVLLIFAGVLAGLFPARRAAKIRPVVALRDE